MSGRFNPFQSKQQEVLRPHWVTDEKQARKLLAKCERKRPCIWVEVADLAAPASIQEIDQLDGATSVVLFFNSAATGSVPDPLPGPLDALVTRLWKHFNKLYLLLRGENGPAAVGEGE